MIKFPSIEQFRNVVRSVKTNHDFKGLDKDGSAISLHTTPYPTIKFSGSVKIHGTNAGIVKYKDRIDFQSRERVLTLQQDNSQFMLNMLNKDLTALFEGIEFNDSIAVFGEWCGQGIQSGVAVSQLSKMFVVFAILIDGDWTKLHKFDLSLNDQGIYHIAQFSLYDITIDFNNPELVQNELVRLTEKVEAECPVGKYFGVSGIGEGIVWKATHEDKFYQFKVKGEKHSVSKVKTLASVDTEMVANIEQFINNTVTEQRLLQGISVLKEAGKTPDQTTTGDFLRWVVGDILKEEQDTIVANQIDTKKLNSAVSARARVWYFNHVNFNNI